MKRRLLFIALMVMASFFIAWRISEHRAFETDMLKLLPASERDPVRLEAGARVRASVMSHTIILVGHAQAERARQAADAYVAVLKNTALFEHIQYQIPPPAPDFASDLYAPYHDNILSDSDRILLFANNVDALRNRLQQQLYSPIALADRSDISGTLAEFLQQHMASLSALRWQDGVLQVTDSKASWIFIDLSSATSPFDDDFQQKALSAFQQAQSAALARDPGTQILRTGTLPYATEARRNTADEIGVIGWIDTLSVMLLLWISLRRFYPMILMTAVIMAALVGATAASLLIFERVHLITFVFGTTLIGIAGDYALHLLVLHSAAGATWNAVDVMRHLRKPLTVALLTTLLAYAAIALTPFDGFRQMAVFCVFGLLSAFASVVWIMPEALAQPAHRSARGMALFTRLIQTIERFPQSGRRLFVLISVVVMIAVPGWWQLRADDDIHQLQSPAPELLAQQQQIAGLLQQDQANQFFLVRAPDAETLLQHEEQLAAALNKRIQAGDLQGYRAVSQWLPSVKRQQENHDLLHTAWKAGAFAQAWATLGMEASDRPPADDVFKALTPDVFFAHALSTPWRLQWLGQVQGEMVSVVLLSGIHQLPALSNMAAIDGVRFVDDTAELSSLFRQFRIQASILVAAAYGIVLLALIWKVGLRAATMRLLPTVMATGLTLAALGYLHQPINLFHDIALLLVLGIGVDYALFLAEGEGHEPASLLAIVMSAATAISVFGLLGISRMPAVAGFGLTVTIGVVLALLLAPMVLLWSARK